MTAKKSLGVPSMKMYPYTSPVRKTQIGGYEQIDIGEYVGLQVTRSSPVVNIYVDYEIVSPSGGQPILHEPVSIQTAEHWVFLNDQPYDATKALGVKRIGPASGMVHTSLSAFLNDMATKDVARYVIVRAVTLPPPSPDVGPPIPQLGGAVLCEGAYRVYQNGQEVGAILATPQAEHWGVVRSYNIEIGFDVEPTGEAWDYARWAAHVNSCYDPCIYWIVTSEAGELPNH